MMCLLVFIPAADFADAARAFVDEFDGLFGRASLTRHEPQGGSRTSTKRTTSKETHSGLHVLADRQAE